MKLLYQHLLSFLLIIVTTISIIGYAEIDYVRNQSYETNFTRMENFGHSIGELAVTDHLGDEPSLDEKFLNQLQFVLARNDVTFRIFNPENQQIYPHTNSNLQLDNKVFNTLRKGEEVWIKNNHEQRTYLGQTKDAYTGILMPWMKEKKLIGVIWIGSTVHNVEKPIAMARKNLFKALVITLVVGFLMSFILAFYSTNKIKRLSRATDKVAAGNFNVQIEHKGHDEIDQLAANFNRMVRTLKKSNDEIRAQEKRETSLWLM